MERRIRISEPDTVDRQLREHGAEYQYEADVTDTYLTSEDGYVEKFSNVNGMKFFIRMRAKDGGFELLERQPITGHPSKDEIHKILRKKRRFYTYEGYGVYLEHVEDVGDFVIVAKDEDDVPKTVFGELGFEDPEFVTVPFSELA